MSDSLREQIGRAIADAWHDPIVRWNAAADMPPHRLPPWDSEAHVWLPIAGAAIAAIEAAGHAVSDSLREVIARAHARKHVLENIWRENAGESDHAFIQRAVGHAWRDYLPEADAALAAIEAAGYVVVPLEPGAAG